MLARIVYCKATLSHAGEVAAFSLTTVLVPTNVMSSISERPKDSIAVKEYSIGDKVYYWKAGRAEICMLDKIVDCDSELA